MTIEELINKLGLAEVSKVDRQLLDHLLHLYNTGQIKAVSISREEVLLQMADAYLNNCLPQIDDIIYRDYSKGRLMDLMEEMWISRPQRRITKLSDLSDGGVIARIKFYNANKEYTVDSFKLMFEDYKKSIYCCQDFIELCQIINDYDYIVDYINNSHFRNELDIFTPEFDKKRTHHITSHKSDKDTLQVKVISNEGVIKSYDMSATGMSFEDMYEIIDKERNGYE